jgi:hypothetical protein
MVSDIPAGDGKMSNSFLQCKIYIWWFLEKFGAGTERGKRAADCLGP